MATTVTKRKVEKHRRLPEPKLEIPHYGRQRSDSGSQMSKKAFWPLVAVSQIFGVACVGLVITWVKKYSGGFSWSDANLQFNYHPVLMVLGLIFLYGDAILVYRVFAFLPKPLLKIIHGLLHVAAIILAAIGLAAVFWNHRRTLKPDLYSIHSWIGLATYIMFCLQYIAGFLAFFLPMTPVNVRAFILPFHQFFGTGIFAMAIASALMGITEKLLWTPNYSAGAPAGLIGNSLGVLLVAFGFIVVYLVTNSSYKRKTAALRDTSARQLSRLIH
ncbi:transmembrane ascorbate-dependent reductase CYB561-like isoform X2 [Uloborus diversus]|uniref:transmembrane ascorbate-dependent reductase CYB561-like isoform X2 n=1 Tax=Uloborus diversus TaxID=327109 RepID=UPI00240A4947|nr:transmembrane ascorbate-dependent reductase CYB561-like isoform X2 [Uloborus diversus]